jgi:hypothetical protein
MLANESHVLLGGSRSFVFLSVMQVVFLPRASETLDLDGLMD